MNTAVINIKTNPLVKAQAQKIASEMGLSLSAVLNRYLKEFIRTKKVNFSTYDEGELTDYAKKALKESEEDYKNGRYISFDDPKDAMAYVQKMIDDSKNSVHKKVFKRS